LPSSGSLPAALARLPGKSPSREGGLLFENQQHTSTEPTHTQSIHREGPMIGR